MKPKFEPGTIVFHQFDALKPHMAMKVLRTEQDGTVVTIYANPKYPEDQGEWTNPPEALHLPADHPDAQ